MAIDTQMGTDEVCYEFHGDALPTEFSTHTSGTSASVAVNPDANNRSSAKSRRGSCVNLLSATTDNGNAEVSLYPRLSPYNGKCSMQTRFIWPTGTLVGAFAIGLFSTTSAGDNVIPITRGAELAKGNPGSNWNFAGLIFDSDAADDDLVFAWMNGGQLVTKPVSELTSGLVLEADKWYDFKVELTAAAPRRVPNGLAVATFDLQTEPRPASDRQAEGKFEDVASIHGYFAPYAGIQSRAVASARSISLDYIKPETSRGI